MCVAHYAFSHLLYVCCTVIIKYEIIIFVLRMAPEVIACDEQPDATYDNRVSILVWN